jgi:uncharacterized protein (TIGR02246 family)
MTRDEAMALFERRRDAWLASDLDAYLDLFAPDLVFQSPAHAEPLVGRDAFAALVHSSAANLAPQEFVFTDLAVNGDVVLAEWHIAAVHRASGKRIAWWGMSTCTIRDGQIARWREYWNPADVR